MSKSSREEQRDEVKQIIETLGAFHEHSICLPSRTLYMGSEKADLEGETGTDSKMAERLIKNLHVLERLSDDPVTIIMDNPGGDVMHGLAIYDAIRLSRCHITAIARGYVMSMGSIIMQAAQERVMGPNAVQMIHYGSLGFSGHAKAAQSCVREDERINVWMECMYLTRIHARQPHFTLERLRELLNFDTYLTAEDSIELGLADRIG